MLAIDFTHWRLSDGSDVEILNWLDDHSRYLLSATVFDRVTGPRVIATFLQAIADNGYPTSTLTDNGLVYTARFRGGRNGFEYLLAAVGVQQKNGHPYHPQTQGKIERFHQTLKRWLTNQTPPATITRSRPAADGRSQVVPNGPRTPRMVPGLAPCRARLTAPTARIVCSRLASPGCGTPLAEIATSPIRGAASIENWPGCAGGSRSPTGSSRRVTESCVSA